MYVTMNAEEIEILKMEVAYLEGALIDARNEALRLRAQIERMKRDMEALTWRALAAEAALEAREVEHGG